MYFRVWFVTSQLVSSLWIFTWGRKIMSERNGTALKQSIMPKSYFVHLRGIMFCPCVQQTCLNISVHVDTQYSTNRTTNHCPYICPFTDGNSIQQECILYMSSACFVHINANSLSLSSCLLQSLTQAAPSTPTSITPPDLNWSFIWQLLSRWLIIFHRGDQLADVKFSFVYLLVSVSYPLWQLDVCEDLNMRLLVQFSQMIFNGHQSCNKRIISKKGKK